MRKSERTPPYIQKAINAKEHLLHARALAWGEKTAAEQYDAFFRGESSFRDEVDTRELNSFMRLD